MRFSHTGRDEGFDAELMATANTGQGVVIMINANDDSRVVARIRDFIARKYHWPDADVYMAPAPGALASTWSGEIAGRYELPNHQPLAFVDEGGHLFVLVGGHPDEEFVPIDADHIVSAERKSRFGVVRDASGAVTGLTLLQGAVTRPVPRIGPLLRDAPPRP